MEIMAILIPKVFSNSKIKKLLPFTRLFIKISTAMTSYLGERPSVWNLKNLPMFAGFVKVGISRTSSSLCLNPGRMAKISSTYTLISRSLSLD